MIQNINIYNSKQELIEQNMAMNDTAKRRWVRAECRADAGGLPIAPQRVYCISVEPHQNVNKARPGRGAGQLSTVLSYNLHCIWVSYVFCSENIVSAC